MTYDFVMGQLRLFAVALISYGTAKGWFSASDASSVMNIIGPVIVIAAPVLWSWSANWRKKYVPADSIAVHADDVSASAQGYIAFPKMDANGNVKAMKIVGALAMFFVLMPALHAADVNAPAPIPALASTACTPIACSGFYAGFSISGNGSNADIIGNGINGSVFAGGIIPSVDGGYIYKNGPWMMGAEAGLGYQVTSNVAGANENGVLAYQVVKAGGDLSALLGTQQPITVPPQLANALISPYVQLGIAEMWLPGTFGSGLVSGAGANFDTGPHSFVNIDYKHIQINANATGLAVKTLNLVTAGWNYKF